MGPARTGAIFVEHLEFEQRPYQRGSNHADELDFEREWHEPQPILAGRLYWLAAASSDQRAECWPWRQLGGCGRCESDQQRGP